MTSLVVILEVLSGPSLVGLSATNFISRFSSFRSFVFLSSDVTIAWRLTICWVCSFTSLSWILSLFSLSVSFFSLAFRSFTLFSYTSSLSLGYLVLVETSGVCWDIVPSLFGLFPPGSGCLEFAVVGVLAGCREGSFVMSPAVSRGMLHTSWLVTLESPGLVATPTVRVEATVFFCLPSFRAGRSDPASVRVSSARSPTVSRGKVHPGWVLSLSMLIPCWNDCRHAGWPGATSFGVPLEPSGRCAWAAFVRVLSSLPHKS